METIFIKSDETVLWAFENENKLLPILKDVKIKFYNLKRGSIS